MVQGSYLNYTILQVLGICGLYRLSKRNLFLRAVLGSLAFVLLHAVEQKLGFGSREDIIVSGFLFLYAMLQRTLRKTGTVSIGQRIRKYAVFFHSGYDPGCCFSVPMYRKQRNGDEGNGSEGKDYYAYVEYGV